jgi:hypothetical protein
MRSSLVSYREFERTVDLLSMDCGINRSKRLFVKRKLGNEENSRSSASRRYVYLEKEEVQ